ncbi:MAG: periplasmic nitrate reductase, NapE protein [Cellvibrionaceae bacterium]
MEKPSTETSKPDETRAFLIIAVLLFPLLSVILVGGMGFIIWISQIIFGPPAG